MVTTSSTSSTRANAARAAPGGSRPAARIAPAGPARRSARWRPTWVAAGPVRTRQSATSQAGPPAERLRDRRPPGCSRANGAASGVTGRDERDARRSSSAGAFAAICAAIASATPHGAAELQRSDQVARGAGIGHRRPHANAAEPDRLGRQPVERGAAAAAERLAAARGRREQLQQSGGASSMRSHDPARRATRGRAIATIRRQWSTRAFTGSRTPPSSPRSSLMVGLYVWRFREVRRRRRHARRHLAPRARLRGRRPRAARRARHADRRARRASICSPRTWSSTSCWATSRRCCSSSRSRA